MESTGKAEGNFGESFENGKLDYFTDIVLVCNDNGPKPNLHKSMKKLTSILLSVVLLSAAPLFAQTPPLRAFAGTSTPGGVVLDSFIAPPGDGTPILKYVNFSSDKAGSVLQFYTTQAIGQITNAAAAATTNIVYVNRTNGLVAGDVIILGSKTTGNFQRAKVHVVGTGSFSFTNNAIGITNLYAIVNGDVFWKATAGGTIPVGITTNSITGGSYSGQFGQPFLIDQDQTTVGAINAAYVEYVK